MPESIIRAEHYTEVRAPDGSVVVPLTRTRNASLCKGFLPPQATSKAVAHKTVDELWFIVNGSGEFFCNSINPVEAFSIVAGDSFTVPAKAIFQFRNTGSTAMEFVIATIPAWPGDAEARIDVDGIWQASS